MKRRRSENGAALILVLWTVVILSFLLLSLAEEIQLESFLTRNLMDQIQVEFIAKAGISRAIADLKGDLTVADGVNEPWLLPIRGSIDDRGSFEVTIEDIGSRININYANELVLSNLLTDRVKDFIEWRLTAGPFYLLQELKQFEGEDFTQLEKVMTYYGKFNLNADDYSVLRQMMVRKRVSDWVADQIVEELRHVEKPIETLDDLFIKVPSLDMSIFEMIQDDVDVIGNININLASEEVLTILARVTGLSDEQVEVITAFREQETIEYIDVLKKDLGEESFKRLAPYLDVSSRYFRITCKAQSASTGIKKEIIVEVARIPEEVARGRVLEWRTEILSWVES